MSDFHRAVLTGDIVNSTKAAHGALEATLQALAETARVLGRWHDADLRFTRFRGDGWQVICPVDAALRVALSLSARLVAQGALRTRLAIGLGQVLRPGTRDLSDASGPAFTRAGAALDAMPRGRRLVLAPEGAAPLAPALVALCDALAQGWTQAQAEALLPMLAPAPPTQDELADRLGIRQQSVGDRLHAARFWALEDALAGWSDQQALKPVISKTGT